MNDSGFPILKYVAGQSYHDWGLSHGEEYREQIKDLFHIRKELMLKRNPSLANHLEPMALAQYEQTLKYCGESAKEIQGIASGSNLTLTDIVILNNYTDFRDIELLDQGCSTVQVQNEKNILSGQTWDMHSSAKNYLCIIEIPETQYASKSLILTVTGCVGLMGISADSCLIGVNNINTTKAEKGLIWPSLVRKVLEGKNLTQMRDILTKAPVTSGHNYLISTPNGAEQWEITPTQKDLVHAHGDGESGVSFHTNHCLGENVAKIESDKNVSATSLPRFEILKDKASEVTNSVELKALLQSHEGYPTSICSHYDTGTSKDPSQTCGGGMANLSTGEIQFWRGCPEYDKNYKEYTYQLNSEDKSFTLKKS
ncbi:C45 family autoproteolytic acyltransferase/hydolase [Halobacteriovorax sp.]|uniref:C45 family autoproteolytic acyltransferase/hydolase n=1 Tax=Halobacteriovorax sp. TaxID=2020862 RepID=UPI0035622170